MAGGDEQRLAELLCARLCHDLAGPIGGVAAGAELLAGEDDERGEMARLIGQSITAASHRLRFLRAALGPGSAAVKPGALRKLVGEFLAASPAGDQTVALDWAEAEDGAEWSPADAKVLMNLIVLARDVLPRGGAIELRTRRAPLAATVVARGPAIAADEVVAALSATSPEALTPRGAQAYYLARLADGLGADLDTAHGTGALTLRLTPAAAA